MHVDKGSTINLTCAVKYSPEPPAYIFWYHHDEVISYDSSRGGVSVITEKGDVTTSHLLIQNADLDDSGKYSCSPSNADVASVRVHVLNGKCNHDGCFYCFGQRTSGKMHDCRENFSASSAPFHPDHSGIKTHIHHTHRFY
uniref:Ig-like domain-containing protein n=1 Tax=Anopheles maculatus TaxID=74869 RepID=A0A182SMZ1_9DIPT